ncbi:MAG: DUF2202 domain-containing protein [Chloroflexi bacterium]|nr:DUF2202 domain-containing protein [Chloroflexota bacterium]
MSGYLPEGDKNTTSASVLSLPASEVSVDEKAALLYTREEEKLARDVYNSLFVTWNNNLFQNIAGSEQKHMDEIALMLTRYNLSDPAQAPGIFTEVKLQDLHDRLVAQGKLTIGDALKVRGAIEEIDILDLQTHLAQTDNADIQLVYKNLMSGSYKHLRSFTSTLTSKTGET